jgi:hypothetical protein
MSKLTISWDPACAQEAHGSGREGFLEDNLNHRLPMLRLYLDKAFHSCDNPNRESIT